MEIAPQCSGRRSRECYSLCQQAAGQACAEPAAAEAEADAGPAGDRAEDNAEGDGDAWLEGQPDDDLNDDDLVALQQQSWVSC